jgi:hypothetical protein
VINDCRQSFANLVTLTQRNFGTELNVTGVVVQGWYGYGCVLQNGQTLSAAQLAGGLLIFLNQNIDQTTATTAACSVTLEVPFFVNGAMAGYLPQILMATVGATSPGTILWNPVSAAQQYILNQLLFLMLPELSLAGDWDLLPPSLSTNLWSYAPGGLQSNLPITFPTNLPASYPGYMAVSKQLLRAAVGTLRLSFVPPSTPNYVYTVGLIFNYQSANEYWVLSFFQASVAVGFSGGYSQLAAGLMHYQNGAVAQTYTTYVGTPSFVPALTSVTLTITQSSPSAAPALALTYSYSTSNFGAGGGSQSPPLTLLPAPALLAGSRVGVFTTWPGRGTFTQLTFSPASGAVQDFLQPPGMKILGRVQVKRDFLMPLTAGGTGPGSAPRSPLADFSMWFWLQLSWTGYGYAYGFGGVGLFLV